MNVSSLGKIGEEVGESEILWVCVSGLFSEGGRTVVLWAVVSGIGLGPSGASVSQKAAQLNSKKDLPQLLKETSPLAIGVKVAPRHNSSPTPSDSDRKLVSFFLSA